MAVRPNGREFSGDFAADTADKADKAPASDKPEKSGPNPFREGGKKGKN